MGGRNMFLVTIFFIIFSHSVISTVYYEYTFVNPQGQAVNNVKVRGYVCSTSCNSIITSNGDLWGGALLSSGNSNKLMIEFPGSIPSEGTGYLIKFFQDDYLPSLYKDVIITDQLFPDTSPSAPRKKTYNFFNKQSFCSSPTSLSVVNNISENLPVSVASGANLDATTASAFNYRLQYYTSDDIKPFYTVETTLYLTIYNWDPVTKKNTGNLIYNKEKVESIYYDDTINVEFDPWTPPAIGYYNVTVKSVVTDGKCSSDSPMTASQLVTVWEEYPRNQCYTLFKDFNTNPLQPEVNEQVTINFKKVTNYASDHDVWNESYTLTPLPTKITLSITGAVTDEQTTILPENPTDDFSTLQSILWTPTQPGNYNLNIIGEAETCPGENVVSDSLTKSIIIDYQDADGDNYREDVDCNDNNPDIYPGAPDPCDGIETFKYMVINHNIMVYNG